jgi:hypothetical protein
MGIVFGRTGVEEPAFRLIGKSTRGYEVRVLPPCVSAAVHEKLGPNGNSGAFRLLAGYIGVIGAPKNSGTAAIAMTAPVVQTPVPIAMTAPVVQTPTTPVTTAGGAAAGAAFSEGNVSLAFLLPAEYTRVDQCPVPTDPRVTLEEVGERMVAVRTFSGWVSDQVIEEELGALVTAARADGLVPPEEPATAATPRSSAPAGLPWQVAQYNPPFTIPWMRRNEVWIHLKDVSEADATKALTS